MAHKRDHIESALRQHGIVFFIFAALAIFGIWSLPHMNKDEFPQFTIRQGVVAAIYPGATAQEVEAQVTKPLEAFINSYSEVDKQNTYSVTEDGIVYVYVMIRNSVKSNNETWAKMRAGLDLFKKVSLPQGVLQVVVVDDFGNTSSMLLAVESAERSSRELVTYAERVCERLRNIPETGNLKILGQQSEEIAVRLDPALLSSYGINQTALQSSLLLQGFRTISGKMDGSTALQVTIPYHTEYDIAEQIIWLDPATGATIRLKDIATIERQYKHADKYVDFYGKERAQCVIINVEMVPGHNIVAFGDKVEAELTAARRELPPDLQFHRITDQPKVVYSSVISFLRDILISILVVIAVMLLLFPLRTALVASTGVPICTAICIGLMYLTGIELNTVTLAALIFVLGMIVDDSVIIIDGYTNMLEQGHSRWYSAVMSTRQLFVPMTLATCSISGMFFPMTKIITGPLGEFVQLFPFAVCFALGASIFYASWVTPYLSTQFIRSKNELNLNAFERIQIRFFSTLQNMYHRSLSWCFAHAWFVWILLVAALASGVFFLTRCNMQLLPKAERECFAVEIHLREGSQLSETAAITDSVANVLLQDQRVVSITSFVGQASPRFHATYTPQMAKPSYAQFIVNTINSNATAGVLHDYAQQFENKYPNAYVRFKQMDYQAARNPLEVYVKGEDLDAMYVIADSIRQYMAMQPELSLVHTDYEEFAQRIQIELKPDEATRLGITETMLSLYLNSVTNGVQLTTIWEDNYAIPVMLYTGVDTLSVEQLSDLMIPTAFPTIWVPLRQVADLVPAWHHSSITRRNAVRTITIGSDLRGKTSQVAAERKIRHWINEHLSAYTDQAAPIHICYGGLSAINSQMIPQILWSVVAALLVMFILLLYHFGKVSLAILALSSSLLCLFGAFLGLYIFGLDISITAVLGIVSLIGIIVRNAIMMYEYAEELRRTRHFSVRDAAFEAGLRRMRPVFLTSATTALGVLPMIIAQTSLWMPMGVVICFGTIFTLPLTITILPVVYWKIYDK